METPAAAFLSGRVRESGFAERISLTGAQKPPAVPEKETQSSRAWPSTGQTAPRLGNSHLGGKGEEGGHRSQGLGSPGGGFVGGSGLGTPGTYYKSQIGEKAGNLLRDAKGNVPSETPFLVTTLKPRGLCV